ncbi:MAG: ribosome small subunit-dependent GTPase A [Clostridia bacterium]|nr:ribosome small subunit-dependent GTPase A [Clostridia bacterium]
METRIAGRLLSCTGGLYTFFPEETAEYPVPDALRDTPLTLRARGVFRYQGESPCAGDLVLLRTELGETGRPENGRGLLMERILPRKNLLIRPPVANLDFLIITAAAAEPAPSLLLLDKLICSALVRGVTPILVINKRDLAPESCDELCAIYRKAGLAVYPISVRTGEGTKELRAALLSLLPDRCAAFAGASGVGKSSCLNLLFPALSLSTGQVSARTGRGRHTTRQAVLHRLPLGESGRFSFLADTPGFGLLDFVHFDFMEQEDLVFSFPEFEPYLGLCRYTKCTHTKEEGCAILAAVENGAIAPSRHESYLALREELKRRKRRP